MEIQYILLIGTLGIMLLIAIIWIILSWHLNKNKIESYSVSPIPVGKEEDISNLFNIDLKKESMLHWKSMIQAPLTPVKYDGVTLYDTNLTVKRGNKDFFPYQQSKFNFQNLYGKVEINTKDLPYKLEEIPITGKTLKSTGSHLLSLSIPKENDLKICSVTLKDLCDIKLLFKQNYMEYKLFTSLGDEVFIGEIDFQQLEHVILHFGQFDEKHIVFGMNGVPVFTFPGVIIDQEVTIKASPEKIFTVFISSI